MEQTLDLTKLTLGQLMGEHFLVVDASESVAQVVDKLRDHQSSAAVYQVEGEWRVLSAELLPELILKGTAALQQPVSSCNQVVPILKSSDSLEKLQLGLQKHAWVGVVSGDKMDRMLNWSSWMRFSAQERLARPYLFSPEWGRLDSPAVQVQSR